MVARPCVSCVEYVVNIEIVCASVSTDIAYYICRIDGRTGYDVYNSVAIWMLHLFYVVYMNIVQQ